MDQFWDVISTKIANKKEIFNLIAKLPRANIEKRSRHAQIPARPVETSFDAYWECDFQADASHHRNYVKELIVVVDNGHALRVRIKCGMRTDQIKTRLHRSMSSRWADGEGKRMPVVAHCDMNESIENMLVTIGTAVRREPCLSTDPFVFFDSFELFD